MSLSSAAPSVTPPHPEVLTFQDTSCASDTLNTSGSVLICLTKGVQFMTLTSNKNYDLLIFKRSTTSNSGVYECSVSDYYVTEARPDNLMVDTINNMDRQVTSNSDSNHFYLEMYRTRGNTTG